MSERTLVTGFGPFLNVRDNPSSRVARSLGRPHQLLDVSFEAVERFVATVDPGSFDLLLLLGVAESRCHLSVEMFARNAYGATPDVQGELRTGVIDPAQPLLLPSTLIAESALATLLATDPRVRMSLDAGSYLCNFTLFKALAAFPNKRVGFVHVAPADKIAIDEQIASAQSILKRAEEVG